MGQFQFEQVSQSEIVKAIGKLQNHLIRKNCLDFVIDENIKDTHS